MKKLIARYKKASAKIRYNRRKRKQYNLERKKLRAKERSLIVKRHKLFVKLTVAKENLDDELTSTHPSEVKIIRLRNRLAEAHAEFDEVVAALDIARGQHRTAFHNMKKKSAKLKWWVKRRTVLRKKIKEAKAKKHPKYEPWMANGYDDNVTPACKSFVARAVVVYDCYVTSMRRTYVPPGGSTTSYHLSLPGKAVDIAGSRMSEFQAAEYTRQRGDSNCLELFGPINDKCLKYGVPMVMDEGSSLEALHDTHVHGAFN